MDLSSTRSKLVAAVIVAIVGMQFGPNVQAALLSVVNALFGGAI